MDVKRFYNLMEETKAMKGTIASSVHCSGADAHGEALCHLQALISYAAELAEDAHELALFIQENYEQEAT